MKLLSEVGFKTKILFEQSRITTVGVGNPAKGKENMDSDSSDGFYYLYFVTSYGISWHHLLRRGRCRIGWAG